MTTFYHGGPSGLARILPPSESGARLTSAEFGNHVTRADRVYVCADPNGALLYAAMHPAESVSVYTVVPVGKLEDDPDCDQPGLSFSCSEAAVKFERKVGKTLRRAVVSAMLADRGRP